MTRRILSAAATLALAATLLGGVHQTAAAADTYDIDGAHSVMVFRVNHLGFANFYGRFNDVSGQFTIDEEKPANSKVTVEVKAESVDTANERRDQHLRSPDFLGAKQFPVIRFVSTGVKKKGDKYEVTGNFTLHGVTKPLTLQLERGRTAEMRGSYRTGFNTSFTLKRTDFGVSYMPEGIGEDVTLMVAIEGVRQ